MSIVSNFIKIVDVINTTRVTYQKAKAKFAGLALDYFNFTVQLPAGVGSLHRDALLRLHPDLRWSNWNRLPGDSHRK